MKNYVEPYRSKKHKYRCIYSNHRSINPPTYQSQILWSWPSKPSFSPRTTGPVPSNRTCPSMGMATVWATRCPEWWPSSRLEPAWCLLSIYRTSSSPRSSFSIVVVPLIYWSHWPKIVIQVRKSETLSFFKNSNSLWIYYLVCWSPELLIVIQVQSQRHWVLNKPYS